ncbi:MAG: hypothetical protein P8Z38_12375 [Robiginitalea sp.]
MIISPEQLSSRDLIQDEDRKILLESRDPYSLSIYLPTHVHGEEVLQKQDSKFLDAELRNIRKELESLSLEISEIEDRLGPIVELVQDGTFWRKQSEGLAIFASGDWFKTFRLPISFAPMHYIGTGFYLVPLVGELAESNPFYLLSLELENIRLFRGSRRGMEEISIEGKVPDRLEDRVGYDYEQKSLQMHRQAPGDGKSGYHGHAESDWDRKNEILRYFRSVDKGLEPLLDPKWPLLIASQEYLAAIYREATSFSNTLEETLIVNLSEATLTELHEGALEVLRPRLEADRLGKWAAFSQFHGTGKATAQMDEILRAAVEGRIDTLFIASGAELWGTFDDRNLEVHTVDKPSSEAESLVNRAVRLTLQHGGEVYERDPAEMPGKDLPAAALYRY